MDFIIPIFGIKVTWQGFIPTNLIRLTVIAKTVSERGNVVHFTPVIFPAVMQISKNGRRTLDNQLGGRTKHNKAA
jgi:hypothetical protein